MYWIERTQSKSSIDRPALRDFLKKYIINIDYLLERYQAMLNYPAMIALGKKAGEGMSIDELIRYRDYRLRMGR